MQSHHEIFTFRFNRTNPNFLAGGCITGQVMLWEVNETINNTLRRNNRGSGSSSTNAEDEDEISLAPLMPKHVSSVDHSHKKCVADLFWLPPTTQINYRGQLVSEEHLDGVSHQFITVAPDGLIMVWDTRYESIFNDELRHRTIWLFN
jgi:WD40 repeat protein